MSASIVVNVVQSLQAFPTYRDSTQSFKSFRYGMEFLMKGESLIVFPDIEYTNDYDKPSDIYTGFLYFGEMYYKKTGKPLKFIPVLIDDEKYEIIEREPLYINNFRNESERMREDLIKAINWWNLKFILKRQELFLPFIFMVHTKGFNEILIWS